jgi:DNA (cytosine-5)-methyltransferase 1
MRGDSPPRREARKGIAPSLAARTRGGGGLGTDFDCDGGLIAFDTTQVTHKANRSVPQPGDPCHPLAAGAHAPAITHALRADGFDAREDGTGRGTPLVPEFSPAIKARDYKGPSSDGDGDGAVLVPASGMAVRRLTPAECEKLQGFSPGYTAITYRRKPAAAGPRYRALGNSMAVPCMNWIGRRIAMAESFEPIQKER